MNLQTAIDRTPGGTPPRFFSYRHRVSFEETNVVGNVYFARHISWQGRCREMFLHEHAPEIMAELAADLKLVTLNVSCTYFAELRAMDEVEMRMTLAHMRQHRIGMSFEYLIRGKTADTLAARGFQEIACMRDTAQGLIPCAVPASLAGALSAYQ